MLENPEIFRKKGTSGDYLGKPISLFEIKRDLSFVKQSTPGKNGIGI